MNICGCSNKPRCLNSRQHPTYRLRRYKCPGCGIRWSTVEMIATTKRGRETISDFEAQIFSKAKNYLIHCLKDL